MFLRSYIIIDLNLNKKGVRLCMYKNIETNNIYVKRQGKCSNCNEEALYEENPMFDKGDGRYDLYAITFCKSCGYWYNNVMDDFFTKEEIEENLNLSLK